MLIDGGLQVRLSSMVNPLTNLREPGVSVINGTGETLSRLLFSFSYKYGDGRGQIEQGVPFPEPYDGCWIVGIELLGCDEVLAPGGEMDAPIFCSDTESIQQVRSILAAVSIDDCEVAISGGPDGEVALNIYTFEALFRQHFGE